MVLIIALCVTLGVDFIHLKSICNVSERQMRELEQRAVIKFLWKEGYLAQQFHEGLQAVYGDAAYALSSVYF
jgi:hypothetical protein